MVELHPPAIGPLPPWDPEIKPVIDTWPRHNPEQDGLADFLTSRGDRLPAAEVVRRGVFKVTEHAIAGSRRPITLTVVTPTAAAVRGAIYWLHSGGQVGGAAVAGDIAPVLDIAERHDLVVVAAEYALAPEFPAPAGLEDAYDGFVWTLENAPLLEYPPGIVFLHGLSGGGGLAAGAALLARDAGHRWAGLVLDGPMLDDRLASVSMHQHAATDLPMLPGLQAMWAAITGNDASLHRKAPHAVPGRLTGTDLSGLPPTYIMCGANDPFRDETTAFAEAMWRSGGTVDLHQWAGTLHGFDWLLPETHISQEMTAGRRSWYDRVMARL
ncbi:alpha/beta hydrolase fold domain-containing protein [Catellatospora sichuanensis]|uniref:alpha/beta hydrolase fold domain-containing protein n=1 Tax=Catellatospora sichuanensis TaxID=1969805 RepID=UPI00118337C1|nr:alpha/beta hydrolase fold domain-containing protein [Catellatospora sichuanensis]